MVDDWIDARLSEVAIDRDRAFAMGPFGSNIRAENYQDSGVPVIRGTNLGQPGEPRFKPYEYAYLSETKADELSSSNAHPNDIVFVAQGTVGKVGIIPTDTGHSRFVLSQNFMKVTVDPNRADPLYIFYFFRSSLGQYEIISRVNPTGVPCISKPLTSLREFSVRFPRDVVTQHAIACILGALDDKIELNRRMNQTLEAMARAIFKSWFFDFDPVRTKTDGGQLTGYAPHITNLFPDSLEDSDLGKIPKGWDVRYWGDIISLEYGKSLRGYQNSDGRFPVYGTNGPIGRHDTALCPHAGIIIGRKGAYRGVHFAPQPFFVIDTAFYVMPKEELELRWAYYNMLRMDINGMDSGSAIPSTNREMFYGLRVLVPHISVQKQFVKILTPTWERQIANNEELIKLSAVLDTLLPKLISGELRVPDAKRIVERCV